MKIMIYKEPAVLKYGNREIKFYAVVYNEEGDRIAEFYCKEWALAFAKRFDIETFEEIF